MSRVHTRKVSVWYDRLSVVSRKGSLLGQLMRHRFWGIVQCISYHFFVNMNTLKRNTVVRDAIVLSPEIVWWSQSLESFRCLWMIWRGNGRCGRCLDYLVSSWMQVYLLTHDAHRPLKTTASSEEGGGGGLNYSCKNMFPLLLHHCKIFRPGKAGDVSPPGM